MNIVSFLISFLISFEQCPTKVVIAAGQCLNTLTDDNMDICMDFQSHPDYAKSLFSIISKNDNPNQILVQVLSCGKSR
jgi:hypothetical protein